MQIYEKQKYKKKTIQKYKRTKKIQKYKNEKLQ